MGHELDISAQEEESWRKSRYFSVVIPSKSNRVWVSSSHSITRCSLQFPIKGRKAKNPLCIQTSSTPSLEKGDKKYYETRTNTDLTVDGPELEANDNWIPGSTIETNTSQGHGLKLYHTWKESHKDAICLLP